jgi:hypothetical protein
MWIDIMLKLTHNLLASLLKWSFCVIKSIVHSFL